MQGTPRPPISQRQNDPDMIELRKAASATHVRALRLEASRVTISVVLALSALIAAFVQKAVPTIAISGAIWAVALAVGLNPVAKSLAKRAALLQEMFDTKLFGLPWNKTICGDPIPRYEHSKLASQFPSGRRYEERLSNWYVDTQGIRQPYDVIFCQLQNLAWDARLRRRWARLVLVLVIGWLVLGGVIGYVANLTIGETLIRWYVPSMGAIILGSENYRTQVEIASERERVLILVQAEIENAGSIKPGRREHVRLEKVMRQVQDVILTTRRYPARVPDWFYARFRSADEKDFRKTVDDLRRKLGSV